MSVLERSESISLFRRCLLCLQTSFVTLLVVMHLPTPHIHTGSVVSTHARAHTHTYNHNITITRSYHYTIPHHTSHVNMYRYVFNEMNHRFPTLPFSLRALEDEKQARMGVVECLKHDLLHPYPVRVFIYLRLSLSGSVDTEDDLPRQIE